MPTYRGNRRRKACITGRPLRKRSCTTQKKLIRTIVCIPHSHAKFIDDLGEALAISIPRGRARSKLFRKGLVGKLEIFSHWTEFEVYKQISDMFFQCFEPVLDCNTLEFHFLSSIPGLKLLQRRCSASKFSRNSLYLDRFQTYMQKHSRVTRFW